MRDLASNIGSRQSLAPLLRTTTATGEAIDRLGFESMAFVVHVGAWTDGTHTVSLEHSDDNSSWAAVGASGLVGEAPAIADNGESPSGVPTYEDENVVFGYIGDKRYVRAKVTVTGSPGTGAFIGIDAVLGHAHSRPVA